MKADNYEIYCDQLKDAIAKYPNLNIIEKGDRQVLKGVLDIFNDDKILVGNYLMEIHFTSGFPFRFPRLFEKGNEIINHIDWHKFSDESCCITVLPDEILKCKSGITVLEFIEKYCFSFFANHIHRKLTERYLNGEYAHGPNGIAEFYVNLLKTEDTSIWIKYFNHVFKSGIFSIERNLDCFCGSKVKFKKCHKLIFDDMWSIGEYQIVKDFKSIIV